MGGGVMPKIDPWHSKKPNSKVYHDNSKCHLGNNIEKENWVSGKGSKQYRCNVCEKLNNKGR
jgi:hypothetical protein